MATTPEKLGRDITVAFAVGFTGVGTLKCTAKAMPGIDEAPEIDASTDNALLTTRLMYFGLPKVSNIVLTAGYDIVLWEAIKDAALAGTADTITFTSAYSSATVTCANVSIIGVKPPSIDSDGFPTMDITIGFLGGVTGNEPAGAGA